MNIVYTDPRSLVRDKSASDSTPEFFEMRGVECNSAADRLEVVLCQMGSASDILREILRYFVFSTVTS
jgi:hypothetical protein